MEDHTIETLILRFRDLVTEPAETIKLHEDKCKEKGYVWWGWWNKASETIPDKEIRIINEKARSNGLDIYLMDSGLQKLHKANCKEIKWDSMHQRIPTPEEEATPEYYKEKPCLMWLKLSNIECVEEKILHDYSYIRVDDVFNDKPSKYKPFYGKMVYSISELRQQERSIWFVRKHQENDPIHHVELLDSKIIDPCDFNTEYIKTYSSNILWVSDLHYSEDKHNYPLKSTGADQELSILVENALKDNGVNDIGSLLVTGDLTWKAVPKEFKYAKNFLKRIISWSGLQNYQIAIVPGNHDLAFSNEPDKKSSRVEVTKKDSKKAYEKFYSDLFFLKPNHYLCSGRKLLLGNIRPIEVICLNSSLLEQQEDLFQGHGFIGDEQLRKAASEFGWPDIGNSADDIIPYRIVIMHHHLVPVTYREKLSTEHAYSVVLDAEALAQWIIKYKIKLVLHGHMHKPFIAKVSRPTNESTNLNKWHTYYILGMGSTGVNKEHLGESDANNFGIINFGKHDIGYKLFNIKPNGESCINETYRIPYE